ncbi:hypothetical protein FisN_29Lh016 [Fistulifera solaris]|uniref:Uncharacterized protein n=1 Tax=Fistulifera solaris TaxID=1519565 RepID=A0A1Z5JLT6_FISSO|nr:hypothetical protein FisN_29Lh016 [Fistulifera solaris]|eukprot:GAX14812.1 hypothetical protein FisN_29Lh016 [Fistulifera solaris]
MFRFTILLCMGVVASVSARPFLLSSVSTFGIVRGGTSSNISLAEDYERAEKTIFNSLVAAEKALEHAIHQEVDALFHDDKDHHKAKASEAIQKGAAQVRESRNFRSLLDRKHPKVPDHPDSNVLYAIEASEKAMMDAVRKEVDLLFHFEPKKEQVQTALANVQARKDQHDEKRQQYLLSSYKDMIENYESYVWE